MINLTTRTRGVSTFVVSVVGLAIVVAATVAVTVVLTGGVSIGPEQTTVGTQQPTVNQTQPSGTNGVQTNIPLTSDVEMQSPTQTPTLVPPTPTPTRSPTPTPDPTPTATTTPVRTEPTDPYYDFELEFIQQLDVRSTTSVRVRGVEVYRNVLWVVTNSTSPSQNASKLLSERNNVANAYARTYQIYQDGHLDGEQPGGLRYIEVNASNTDSPKTFEIGNSVVRDYVFSDQTFIGYRKQWSKTLRNRTEAEIDTVNQIDKTAGNATL